MSNTQPNPAPKGEQCQCPTCGLTFVGDSAFMRHRTGELGLPKGDPNGRRCKTLPEMLADMQQTVAGLWRILRGGNNPASGLRTAGFQAHAGATPGRPTGPLKRTPSNRPVRSPVKPPVRVPVRSPVQQLAEAPA